MIKKIIIRYPIYLRNIAHDKLCNQISENKIVDLITLETLPMTQKENPNKLVSDKILILTKQKSVFVLNNKLNLASKQGDCIICYQHTKIIPRECSHYYCSDCYIAINKCSICGFE